MFCAIATPIARLPPAKPAERAAAAPMDLVLIIETSLASSITSEAVTPGLACSAKRSSSAFAATTSASIKFLIKAASALICASALILYSGVAVSSPLTAAINAIDSRSRSAFAAAACTSMAAFSAVASARARVRASANAVASLLSTYAAISVRISLVLVLPAAPAATPTLPAASAKLTAVTVESICILPFAFIERAPALIISLFSI